MSHKYEIELTPQGILIVIEDCLALLGRLRVSRKSVEEACRQLNKLADEYKEASLPPPPLKYKEPTKDVEWFEKLLPADFGNLAVRNSIWAVFKERDQIKQLLYQVLTTSNKHVAATCPTEVQIPEAAYECRFCRSLGKSLDEMVHRPECVVQSIWDYYQKPMPGVSK